MLFVAGVDYGEDPGKLASNTGPRNLGKRLSLSQCYSEYIGERGGGLSSAEVSIDFLLRCVFSNQKKPRQASLRQRLFCGGKIIGL